jgi:hypothetical protein
MGCGNAPILVTGDAKFPHFIKIPVGRWGRAVTEYGT